MRIPEFAEILIAQTGAWLRRGVYPALRFLSPRLPLFEGWRPENDRFIPHQELNSQIEAHTEKDLSVIAIFHQLTKARLI
jgi:hypothetical protein